jgi:hypothetical protein
VVIHLRIDGKVTASYVLIPLLQILSVISRIWYSSHQNRNDHRSGLKVWTNRWIPNRSLTLQPSSPLWFSWREYDLWNDRKRSTIYQ